MGAHRVRDQHTASRSRFMRRYAVSAILLAAVLVGCGPAASGAVKVAGGAVDDAASVLGASRQTVALTGDDVSRLAGQARVSDDAIQSVAPRVNSQPLWNRSMRAARNVAVHTEGEVRALAISVACDAVNGKVHTYQDLYGSLAGHLQGMSATRVQSVAEATLQLWQNLYTAYTSDYPEERAAAAILCYTFQAVS